MRRLLLLLLLLLYLLLACLIWVQLGEKEKGIVVQLVPSRALLHLLCC